MHAAIRTTAFTVAAMLLAGVAHAEKVESPDALKKGEALPPGQAALLMVIDRGTRHSSVKRPEPATFVIVAVPSGTPYRLSDVDDATVRVVPPGKYYLKDAYSQTRALEVMGIHDASKAFEVKADVLTYVGAWKFSNDMTKNTQSIGLEITYAAKPLETALKAHPQFVADGKVVVTGPGQQAKPLGAN
jgi:hypothetical protein